MRPLTSRSPHFPYTTLFRSWGIEELRSLIAEQESIAQQINDHHGTGGVRSIAAAKDALRADPSRVLHGTEALQAWRSEEHTSELQSRGHLVCRLLLEKKKPQREERAHGARRVR